MRSNYFTRICSQKQLINLVRLHNMKILKEQTNILRDSIVLYKDIINRLEKFIINKTDKFVLTNTDYMNCMNFVYNTITNSSLPGKMRNQKEKIEQRFFDIYLYDLNLFCSKLLEALASQTRNTEDYLFFVDQQIQGYKLFMWELFKIMRHLDGHFLKNMNTPKTLFIEGALILKQCYIERIYEHLISKLYEILSRFKSGEIINKEVVSRIIYTIGLCGFSTERGSLELEKKGKDYECEFRLTKISPYETNYFKQKFINPIVEMMNKDYAKKALKLLELSTPENVKEALRFLDIEQKCVKTFYDNEVPRKIFIKSTELVLGNVHGREIMDNEKTGLYTMLNERKFEQLKQIYQLISRTDHLPYFSIIFQRYIQKQGNIILETITPEDQKQLKKEKIMEMIHKLLDLKDLVDLMVSQSLGSDIKLQQGRDNAFHLLVNKSAKVSNFLCYYADLELKKERNEAQESNLIISQILKIFRYIYSTDAFLKTYQKLLCMRILNDNFKNRDMEIQLINKLKAEAGAGALNKITTMITDINNSDKFYGDFVKNNPVFNKEIEFKITILTTGSWPITDPKCGKALVPQSLQPMANNLEHIYSSKFPGKSLTWIFTYGSALLVTKFKANVHHLQVSGIQLLILMKFEYSQVKQLKVSDILNGIKIEENLLNATIGQLVKLKILTKSGDDKINTDDVVGFNEDFTFKNKRVNCILQQKHVEKPNQSISDEIIKERELVIDSVVVKVMKTRKIVRYEEVVSETTKLVKIFKAEQPMIKRRLEALIQREFIKRDDRETNMLVYIP